MRGNDRNMAALIDKAIAVALLAHSGAVDKGGSPYILHPLRVMHKMQTPEEMVVAILHDVVEDSNITLEVLQEQGMPSDIITALDHLTRRKGETYAAYLRRCAENPLARTVKLADLNDNMNLKRIPVPTEQDEQRIERYRKARAFLLQLDVRYAIDNPLYE